MTILSVDRKNINGDDFATILHCRHALVESNCNFDSLLI